MSAGANPKEVIMPARMLKIHPKRSLCRRLI